MKCKWVKQVLFVLTVMLVMQLRAEQSDEDRTAFEVTKANAESGDARAEFDLGRCYAKGKGVEKNEIESVKWYLKAAEQNNVHAQYNLGGCYLNGQGVPKDYGEAVKWFRKAAEQNHARAEHNLGVCYEYGRGVTKDETEAVKWFLKAAEQNDNNSQQTVGHCYFVGQGVKQNDMESLAWYEKAQGGNPQDKEIKKMIAIVSLMIFLKNEDSSREFNWSLIFEAFHREILLLIVVLLPIYAIGGVVLFYFSFKTLDSSPKISLAVGWLVFYFESQFVAALILCILGRSLTAAYALGGVFSFGALPVIASSFGQNRSRIWRASQVSWKILLLYAAGGYLAAVLIDQGYAKIYELITHSPLPHQSTLGLFMKAKYASAWLTFTFTACVVPIAEEIMFRCYLFDALRRYLSGNVVIIVTALIFALLHFQWLSFVPIFALGLLLGWIKLKTDSIRLPIILHVLNNAIAVALAT